MIFAKGSHPSTVHLIARTWECLSPRILTLIEGTAT